MVAKDIVNINFVFLLGSELRVLRTVADISEGKWDHFVVMFGGLHIEVAALKMLGDLLEDSGWTGVLVQAGVAIATSGRADSLLKASHVTHTRRAHQVTVSSLHLLLQKVYAECSEDTEDVMSLEDWCAERGDACSHWYIWSLLS
jgi:hypothetical protein